MAPQITRKDSFVIKSTHVFQQYKFTMGGGGSGWINNKIFPIHNKPYTAFRNSIQNCFLL